METILKSLLRLLAAENTLYYGNVFLHVIDNFGIVSIFLFNHGYAGGKYMLRYSEICSTNPPCFNNPNTMGLSQNEGNLIIGFNGSKDPVIQYGFGKGIYLIQNVPKVWAITLLNEGNKDRIYMSSSPRNDFITGRVNGVVYQYHYGNVLIHVTDDFGVVSVGTILKGYHGGEYLFKYSDKCFISPSASFTSDTNEVQTTNTNLVTNLYQQIINLAYTYANLTTKSWSMGKC